MLTANFVSSTANAYQRLMALTSILHLATEDACMNAYLFKMIKSRLSIFGRLHCWLDEMKDNLLLIDAYTHALNELALEVTQERYKDIKSLENEAARTFTNKLIHIMNCYR